MNGHSSVSQKCFWTSGGNFDFVSTGEYGSIFQSNSRNGGSTFNFVVDVVHSTSGIAMLNLIVCQGSSTGGTPVYKIISSINKSSLIQGNKDLPHCLGKPFVHGKPFPAPVNAVSQLMLLASNDFVMLFFYRPGSLQEFFPT